MCLFVCVVEFCCFYLSLSVFKSDLVSVYDLHLSAMIDDYGIIVNPPDIDPENTISWPILQVSKMTFVEAYQHGEFWNGIRLRVLEVTGNGMHPLKKTPLSEEEITELNELHEAYADRLYEINDIQTKIVNKEVKFYEANKNHISQLKYKLLAKKLEFWNSFVECLREDDECDWFIHCFKLGSPLFKKFNAMAKRDTVINYVRSVYQKFVTAMVQRESDLVKVFEKRLAWAMIQHRRLGPNELLQNYKVDLVYKIGNMALGMDSILE